MQIIPPGEKNQEKRFSFSWSEKSHLNFRTRAIIIISEIYSCEFAFKYRKKRKIKNSIINREWTSLINHEEGEGGRRRRNVSIETRCCPTRCKTFPVFHEYVLRASSLLRLANLFPSICNSVMLGVCGYCLPRWCMSRVYSCRGWACRRCSSGWGGRGEGGFLVVGRHNEYEGGGEECVYTDGDVSRCQRYSAGMRWTVIFSVCTPGCGWKRWSNEIKCGNMEGLGEGRGDERGNKVAVGF